MGDVSGIGESGRGIGASGEVPADVIRMQMGHEDSIDIARMNPGRAKFGNEFALVAADEQTLDGARVRRRGADSGVR